MILVRFKVVCQPNKAGEMAATMKAVIAPARALPGVIHFDIARDLTDENVLIATEVFENRESMQREEELPEVAGVVALMESGALASPPEWTIYEIASAESPAL
jgi:quinol monooxygenase YgiN